MPTYIPGISSAGTLAPGLTAATVRAVLELLSVAEIAAAYATTAYVDDEVSANGVSLQAFASNASNLSSGTISDARLSSNVPKLSGGNSFSGNQVVTGNITTSGNIVVNGSAIGARSDIGMLLFNSLGSTQSGVGIGSFGYNPGFICGAATGIAWTSDVPTSARTSSITQASAGVLQIGTGGNNANGSLNLANLTASGGITFGPRTKSALLATSATATAGVWRITDSTPAQRLAYPDGTNWRYMSDDTVVT